MTTKKDPTRKLSAATVAAVNWDVIARFLGQPVENVDRVRRMELQPGIAVPLDVPKR